MISNFMSSTSKKKKGEVTTKFVKQQDEDAVADEGTEAEWQWTVLTPRKPGEEEKGAL